jgi:hypothetical protein
MELPTGERAVVAEPDDYEVAHRLFAATSRRTVVNISDTHRKILDALYELQQDDPIADGFPQRAIAEQAGVQQGTVSKHKAFLAMSAKLVRETDHGLALVGGAEPSWWDSEGLMRGFPTPAQVQRWWQVEHPPPDGPGTGDHRNTENARNHHDTEDPPACDEWCANVSASAENGHGDNQDQRDAGRERARNRDSGTMARSVGQETGLPEPKNSDGSEAIPGIPVIPAGSMPGSDANHEPSLPVLTARGALEEPDGERSGPYLTAAKEREHLKVRYLGRGPLNGAAGRAYRRGPREYWFQPTSGSMGIRVGTEDLEFLQPSSEE